jgi:tetratricopeptide (TPR) repeat protein
MKSTEIKGFSGVLILAAVALIFAMLLPGPGFRTATTAAPKSYLLSRVPGTTSLHMAMIHDVLLDRYLRHGSGWYEARAGRARQLIAAREQSAVANPVDEERLSAMDDLAVALESLHHSDEAAAVMRRKLRLLPAIEIPRPPPANSEWRKAEQEEVEQIIAASQLPPLVHHQYTARANLGTSLIHGSLRAALAGDADAAGRLREGLKYIQESIALNPGAHFGREKWQALVVEHFLAAITHPELLTTYDMIGERLDRVHEMRSRHASSTLHFPPAVFEEMATVERRMREREDIERVGIDEGWAAVVEPTLEHAAPFDEPALALMGMWMLGGGPNPYSAMALANIAYRENQQEIAWDGYERAQELASGLPSEEVQMAFMEYCRRQQMEIARRESPEKADQWQARTRVRHRAELAWAHRYQEEYQAFEAQQIAAGVPMDDPAFYSPFRASHPPIASPVGSADTVTVVSKHGFFNRLPMSLLAAGTVALLASLFLRK